jgi:hypothetical protein
MVAGCGAAVADEAWETHMVDGPAPSPVQGGLAPSSSAAFGGISGTVTITWSVFGVYRVGYDSESAYAIVGVTPGIPNSYGTYTYQKTGPDKAEMVFQDSGCGRVVCDITYVTRLTGRGKCTYGDGLELSSRFSVP